LWELPQRILVEQAVKSERQCNPDDTPDGRLTERDLMGLTVKHAEVES
jgi:hypothetical protein